MTPEQYLAHLQRLLDTEHESERNEFLTQVQGQSTYERTLRGTCWYPLSIEGGHYNALNQYVVEIVRTGSRDVEHQFDHGKPVSFFADDGMGHTTQTSWSGTVSYVDGDRMGVVIPSEDHMPQLRSMRLPGLQLFFDETPYRLMSSALHKAINASDGRLKEMKELLHGTRQCASRTMAKQSFPWLNRQQEEAVNKIICAKDIAIVHGPPGTGKTTTLVEAICETLHRETQVLVCAQSNMAVDWISRQLVERGISVMRIGNPTRINGKMLAYTFERRFEEHPDYPLLWQVRRSIRELCASRHGGRDIHSKLSSLRDKATELEVRITSSLFDSAMVISCTLTGAASSLLFGKHFSTLFVDEAGQALEPSCWIPLAHCSRIILSGDHKQLPPTVKSVEAARGGLARTLMEVAVNSHPSCVTMLREQYRMNEEIMTFPSKWFYGGQLTAAPMVAHRKTFELDTPVEWIDMSTAEARERSTSGGTGKMNAAEACATIDTLKSYISKIGSSRIAEDNIDFAIISPYKSQVQLLRRLIKSDPGLRRIRHAITTDTVDGFQGQERDVVIISLVRSNDRGDIGFLTDLRRMNVAMTRARMKLIIVGDVTTLSRHTFFAALHDYVTSLNRDCN